MPVFRRILVVLLVAASPAAMAQAPRPATFPDGPGRDVLAAKCFQCHGPGMWVDHRADRRNWESVLYRMVGRGGLWTEDEIAAMAGYLAANYGLAAPAAAKP
jgi:mono/diheme cytochrome c family protein